MPINSLYNNHQDILDKVCYIKDYMDNNNLNPLKLHSSECNYVSIRFNTSASPDGAKGMFLLVRKNLVIHKPKTDLEKLLVFNGNCNEIEIKINQNIAQFNEMYSSGRRRLQEKFEFYTYKRLEEKGYDLKLPRDINEYDFLINNNIAVEIKTDQWISTGNVSLELLRNHDISNCKNTIENIGSILKSTADYWQEYFYNKTENKIGCSEFKSELYKLERLQEETLRVINCLYDKIKIIR